MMLAPALQVPALTTAKSSVGAPCIIAVTLPMVVLLANVNVSVSAGLVCPTGIVPKFPVCACIAVTVTVTAFDVLPALLLSPPYTAVTEFAPRGSIEVANVATPEPFSIPVPSVAAPSMNVTLPVGVIPPVGGVTVAVNVTLVPTTTFVALAVSTLELVAEFTVTEFAPAALV